MDFSNRIEIPRKCRNWSGMLKVYKSLWEKLSKTENVGVFTWVLLSQLIKAITRKMLNSKCKLWYMNLQNIWNQPFPLSALKQAGERFSWKKCHSSKAGPWSQRVGPKGMGFPWEKCLCRDLLAITEWKEEDAKEKPWQQDFLPSIAVPMRSSQAECGL